MKKILSMVLSLALLASTFTTIASADELEKVGDSAPAYADYDPGAVPENMVTEGANGEGGGIGACDANWYGGNGGTTCVIDDGHTGKGTLWKSTKDHKINTWYGAGPFFIDPAKAKGMADITGGKTYVFSIWVKNTSDSNVTAPMLFTAAFGTSTNIKYSNEYPKGTYATIGKDWTEFTATYTFPSDYSGSKSLFTGYPSGVQAYTGQAIVVDDFYFAEEVMYDINVTASAETVEQRGTLDLSSAVVNQIGSKSKYPQDVNWYVVNAERTEKITSGFTFSSQSADTTLSVAKDVAPGKYVVMAESTADSKFKKGIEIEVTREVLKDNGSIMLAIMPADVKPSYDVFSEFTVKANNIAADDINWFAVKENRMDIEDKITITPTTGTNAKVSFVDGIEDGKYYLVAQSKKDDSKRKMVEIVIDNSSVIDAIVADFNSGSTTAWESKFEQYVVLIGEDSESYKKADKAEILKLIVEQSKVEAFTKANLSDLFKGIVALSLYNKNTNGVELNDETGAFNFEADLGLDKIDQAGVTVYDIYKNSITKEGQKKVIADLTGKDFKNVVEFKDAFIISTILNAIAYPKVLGFQYVGDILTAENMDAAKIDKGNYLTPPGDNNSGYNKEIARKIWTKSQLEAILAKEITDTVEDEEYKKPDGEEYEYEVPVDVEGTIVPEKKFTDVPESHWAYSHIYFLNQIGVVSGVSEDLFNPDGIVTREVAAKMICKAFNVKPTGEAKNFTDVDPNAWYAESIRIASSAGVVNGISDTEFGVGLPVTRQDLCVMIVRAMNTTNANISALEFEDSDQIADYAEKAVSYLSILAIVNGYNDNTFRPLGYCKRAEIAKIISQSLNTIDSGDGDGNVKYSAKEELLFGIGAVDLEKYSTNSSVSRAGFANFIYDVCIREPYDKQTAWENNVLNPPVVGDMKNMFTDLDESHLDYNSIAAVVNKGYMEGISENIFAPDIQINLSYAIEVLLDIMGYAEIAEISGGKDAYIELAGSLGLLDGVYGDVEAPAKYRDVVRLFANCLNTGVNKVGSIKGKNIVLKADSSKSFMTEVLKIDYVEGIMTDNGITSLTGPSKISENKIKVAGVEIVVPEGVNSYSNLIGRNVKAYYDCSEKGVNKLIFVAEKSYEDIYTFDLDDFVSYDGTTLVYETERGEKNLAINSAAQVIYNDSIIDSYDESLFKDKNGDVTVLSVYKKNDYIIVNEYKDFYVSKVNADSERVYSSVNYIKGDEVTLLDLKKGSEYEKINISYASGEIATFADIKEGQILALKLDKTNKIATIIINEESFKNVLVKSVSGDEITIEEGIFEIAASLKNSDVKVEAGKSYNIYLNKFGYVAYAEEVKITDGKQMGILARTIDNEDEEIYGAKIYDQNKAIVLYSYAERVNVNGTRTLKTAVNTTIKAEEGEPVIFTVTDGKITEITTPEDYSGSDDERGWYKIIEPYASDGTPVKWVKPDGMTSAQWSQYKYDNWYLYTSAGDGPSFGGRFTQQTGITNVYVVPVEKENYTDDSKYSLNSKTFASHSYVMVDAYAYDKNSTTPDVIIAREEAKKSGSINIRNVFVVTGMTQGLSENEEPRDILQGYKITANAVTYAELPVSEDAIVIGQKRYATEIDPAAQSEVFIKNNGDTNNAVKVNSTVGNIGPRVADEIGVGDIFRYAVDSNGDISTIAMNFDYDVDDDGHKNHGLQQVFEPWGVEACATYGYVIKADSNNLRILGKYHKKVNGADIELVLGAKPASTDFGSYDGYTRTFGFPVTASYKVLFIEEGANGKMTSWIGTLDDVISYEDAKTGYDEMIVLSAYKGGKLAAVVYR